MYEILKLLHLISASVWLGGMIMMGAFVPVVRKIDDSGTTLKALASRFGQIGWGVYFLALFSGMGMFLIAWGSSDLDNYFHIKMTLFVIAGVLTFIHSKAGKLEPKFRGMIQGLILLSTIGIFYSAIMFSG